MQVFVEVWLTLEMLYRTRQFFMMEDAAMRCITRMPISMRKIIESYLNKNMEMTMFFIQEALHPDLNTLRVSSAGIS